MQRLGSFTPGRSMKVGDCVYIRSFPDHTKKCKLSGCPTWRSAVGVLIEKLYEYDGSQARVIVLVEGKEHYFMNYQVEPMGEER